MDEPEAYGGGLGIGGGDATTATELILRNGHATSSSVMVDIDETGVNETTRLYTVSDEEDGLGMTSQLMMTSLQQHQTSSPLKQSKNSAYPKELKKTIAALIIMCLNFVLTTASLSVVHEYLPDYDPLPDLILNHLPYQEWALFASELTIQIQVGVAIAIIVFHKHRTIVVRRVALMLSLLYGYRAITMMVTVLPKANPLYYCSPKLKSQDQELTLATVVYRVAQLLSGFGLTMNGKHTFCGDFIFSGHTMTLVLSCLAVHEYTSRRLWPLHWLYVLSTISGVCFLMLGRGHYSIDVLIAYWITTRLWYLIHAMACHASLKQSTNINYFSRLWWWSLFRWFECNVRPGPIPHGFNLPLPLWVWACVSKVRYYCQRGGHQAGKASGSGGSYKPLQNSSRHNRKKLKEVP